MDKFYQEEVRICPNCGNALPASSLVCRGCNPGLHR